MLLIVMHVQNLVKIHLFIFKILSGNEILMSFKDHNTVMNWRKWTLNNPTLDVININAYVKFGQTHSFILKILSGNEILTSFKGHNPVMNWRKWTLNNPKLDVVNISACAKCGQNSSKFPQAIERKRKCYGRAVGQTDTWKQYTPIIHMRGY